MESRVWEDPLSFRRIFRAPTTIPLNKRGASQVLNARIQGPDAHRVKAFDPSNAGRG